MVHFEAVLYTSHRSTLCVIPGNAWQTVVKPLRLDRHVKTVLKTKTRHIILQNDHQARFYEDCRRIADEYDKQFLKEYGKGLDTPLWFVGFA